MSWNGPEREDTTIDKVVVNHEEQYSIWARLQRDPARLERGFKLDRDASDLSKADWESGKEMVHVEGSC